MSSATSPLSPPPRATSAPISTLNLNCIFYFKWNFSKFFPF